MICCTILHGFLTGTSVQCNVFPVARSNMEFLQNCLNVVLIRFILSTSCSTAFLQLGVQDLFGETCIGHADDMARPSKLITVVVMLVILAPSKMLMLVCLSFQLILRIFRKDL